MALSRRHFLRGTACALTVGAAALAARSLWIPGTDAPSFYSCCKTDGGDYRLSLVRHAKELFNVILPGRGHSLAASHDGRYLASVARRPGTWLYVIDAVTGEKIAEIAAEDNDYFNGHVRYSKDNRYLFATQSNGQTDQGYIGVYDAQNHYQLVDQWYTAGLDPHELALLNRRNVLVVANGGYVKTAKDDKPENPDAMDSSLVYLDASDGKILAQYHPPQTYMSLRHLAVGPDDEVTIGVQYHGQMFDEVPLILGHKGEDALQAYQASASVYALFSHYIASVAADHLGLYALSTSPKKGAIVLWDSTKRVMLKQYHLRDVAGAYWSKTLNNFVVSNSLGQVMMINPRDLSATPQIEYIAGRHWDNHMIATVQV